MLNDLAGCSFDSTNCEIIFVRSFPSPLTPRPTLVEAVPGFLCDGMLCNCCLCPSQVFARHDCNIDVLMLRVLYAVLLQAVLTLRMGYPPEKWRNVYKVNHFLCANNSGLVIERVEDVPLNVNVGLLSHDWDCCRP